MRGLVSSSFDIVQLHALFYICLVLLLVYQCFDISNCQGLFPVLPILFKEFNAILLSSRWGVLHLDANGVILVV